MGYDGADDQVHQQQVQDVTQISGGLRIQFSFFLKFYALIFIFAMQTINVHSFPCESFLSHQNGKSDACWISLGTAGLRSDGFDVLEFPGEVDAEEEEPGGLDHAPAELVGVE